ncbi:Uncharacterized protein DBV15_12509 [Temnothorax longispinosus]|uniref:Transposable element P transposase-like RNase H domain-containing protein n=1 Tax=Temnothorax longispinosus TaxID=300112 RepID=A0A4S2KY19_9HYME|nr:Uncharacterized protein DBV15_12509 [Temnothorax longispinosus]
MFIDMQIKNLRKHPKGIRFTLDEKILALSYKESHSGYKLLQQLFTLPSSRTLRRLLQKVPIHAGINNIIFSYLSHQQSLITNVIDKLYWGHKRTQRIADHALVFMLRGIRTGWKIPLSHNFCKSQTKTPQLMRYIKEIVHEITKAGFIIVATICDQGSSNVAALNQFLSDSRSNCLKKGEQFDETIILDNQKIIVLYDPPHLLKEIRNNFLEKDIEIMIDKESNVKEIASWNIIETAYNLDIHKEINKKSVFKDYIDTNIGPLRIPREEGFATANILDFFNKLFDSVNGQKIKSDTPLRNAITRNSAHHSFWYDAIKELQNIKFIDKKKKTSIYSIFE